MVDLDGIVDKSPEARGIALDTDNSIQGNYLRKGLRAKVKEHYQRFRNTIKGMKYAAAILGLAATATIYGCDGNPTKPNNPPGIEIIEPSANAAADTLLAMVYRVTDPDKGDNLLVGLFYHPESDSTLVTTIADSMAAANGAQEIYNWNTKAIANGIYKLLAIVNDQKGGTDEETITITIGHAPGDITSPYVLSINLTDNFPVSDDVIARISESLNPSTVNSSNVTLEMNGNGISGVVTYDSANKRITFNPDSDLGYHTDYIFSIMAAVADTANNAFDGNSDGTGGDNYTKTFRTAEAPDLTPPYVSSTNLTNNFGIGSDIEVIVSESLDPTTVNSSNITLGCGSNSISGTVTYDDANKKIIFNPDSDLGYLTDYTLCVTGDVKDKAGNAFDGNSDGTGGDDYTEAFRTAEAPDLIPPYVSSTNLNNNFGISSDIEVIVSESLDSSTVNSSNIILEMNGNSISGTVTYDDADKKIIFNPDSDLGYLADYILCITGNVKDKSGNAFDGNSDGTGGDDYAETFTTEQAPRTIEGVITDFYTGNAISGVTVYTKIDSSSTDANGYYLVFATDKEIHLAIIKEGYLESGDIIPAGIENVIKDWSIVEDNPETGVDGPIFRDYILSNRHNGPPFPDDLVYVSLTEESVPDTAYIAGKMDWYERADGFQNVAQLNKIAEKINVMANSVTKGLYGVNRTTIVIADSNFTNPESVALFAYSNMVAVGNEECPSTAEELKNYLTIFGSDSDLGLNGTFYAGDGLTIKGHVLILGNYLTPEGLDGVINTEFCSSILGGVETPSGYPSVFGPAGRTIRPHDYRIMWLTIDRGPGRMYPDLPKGFNPGK